MILNLCKAELSNYTTQVDNEIKSEKNHVCPFFFLSIPRRRNGNQDRIITTKEVTIMEIEYTVKQAY